MQAFNDLDCVSRFNECLHLHCKLNNQLNDHDPNVMMDGYLNSLPNKKPIDWPNFKAFCRRQNIKLLKLLFLSLIGYKALWVKERMLVTRIFSFSHDVFKSLLFQGR